MGQAGKVVQDSGSIGSSDCDFAGTMEYDCVWIRTMPMCDLTHDRVWNGLVVRHNYREIESEQCGGVSNCVPEPYSPEACGG